MLKIAVNRKCSRIGLMYSVTPNQFNPKGKGSKYIRSSHPENASINAYLEDKIFRAKDVVAKLEKEGKTILRKLSGQNITTQNMRFICVRGGIETELLKIGNAGKYKKGGP